MGSQVVSAGPEALQDLEPKSVWKYFGLLSVLPRPSKMEDAVLRWLKQFAEDRKLAWQQDPVGNIVIRRPGHGTGESAPTVILQGHVDMVCEKNSDSTHNFEEDSIRLLRDGDWLKADGTTLGADNGIGVAIVLAVLDLPPDHNLPPLECLFTVDEETGLTGAFGLDGSMLQGRILINLDTEDWGEIYIGCAGGGDSVLHFTLDLEPTPPDATFYKLAVSGFMGGHSGLNIHEDRGNAVRVLSEIVDSASLALADLRVVTIQGGDKRNAIPREAFAILALREIQQSRVALEDIVCRHSAAFKEEYGAIERDAAITLTDFAAAPSCTGVQCILPAELSRLLTAILSLPHGVIKYSHAVANLVETSNNVASVKEAEGAGTFTVQCSTRSSLMPALERCRATIKKIGVLCGANVEQDEAYPGWAPVPDSHIVTLARRAVGTITSTEPPLKAIHAGLECGIIGAKLPGLQSVSYGPTITGAHSPDERVKIDTVEPFWRATLLLLDMLADAA